MPSVAFNREGAWALPSARAITCTVAQIRDCRTATYYGAMSTALVTRSSANVTPKGYHHAIAVATQLALRTSRG